MMRGPVERIAWSLSGAFLLLICLHLAGCPETLDSGGVALAQGYGGPSSPPPATSVWASGNGRPDRKMGFDYGATYWQVAVDANGSIYLLGTVRGDVDLDPARPYVPYRTETDDILLTRLDSAGDYQWSRIWKVGDRFSRGEFLATDPQGNILVGGRFQGDFDLDPGPGVDVGVSGDIAQPFLVKLDGSGNYLYGLDWEGDISDMRVDPWGNVYVLGWFPGSTDTDRARDLNGKMVSLTKLGPDGVSLWCRKWYADSDDRQNLLLSRALAIDGNGSVYMSAVFRGLVDFDPGPGVNNRSSGKDVFDLCLVKVDGEGILRGAATWGDEESSQEVSDLVVDSRGRAYVTGFSDVVGPAEENGHIRHGRALLACFRRDLSVEYAHRWDVNSEGLALAVGPDDSVFMLGKYSGGMDIDPGDGTAVIGSTGTKSLLALSRFDKSGSLIDRREWAAYRLFRDMVCDRVGDIYMMGWSPYFPLDRCLVVIDGLGKVAEPPTTTAVAANNDLEAPAEWVVSFGESYIRDEAGDAGCCPHDPTYRGGPIDYVNDLEIDSAGDIYIAGVARGDIDTDFDPGPGVAVGGADEYRRSYPFLSKFHPDGTFVWVRTWQSGVAFSVATDSMRNVAVTGYTYASYKWDLDPGPGIDERITAGPDGFVVKLDSDGNYIWGRTFGHAGQQVGDSIEFDSRGNVYVAGDSQGNSDGAGTEDATDFDPVPADVASHNRATFLAKLSPDGELLWSRNWPWGACVATWYRCYGLAVDRTDNVYLAAVSDYPEGVNFSGEPGADAVRCDGYLVSVDSSGILRWVWPYIGQNSPAIQKLAVGPSGDVNMSGCRGQSDGCVNYFLAEFDTDGDTKWTYDWTGECVALQAAAADLAVDSSGFVYAAGHVMSSYREAHPLTSVGDGTIETTDAAVLRYDPATGSMIYAIWGRGTCLDAARAIDVDSNGNCYVAGVGNGIFLMKLKLVSEW